MKAKKITGAALKILMIAVVGAFLALHSINLFTFVFPFEQQYLAWLGFGLTGLGAVVYLVMFMWEGTTILQKWVSLAMAFICAIGEVLSAYFGMQIETWQKAGFTLTENDFQAMLTIIGILAIAHFFALIAYFAGDKIAELFADDDGDGIVNAVDPDYKRKQFTPRPQTQGANNPNNTTYSMSTFLSASKMKTEQAFSDFLEETETFGKAWQVLRDRQSAAGYVLPPGISHKNFNELAGKVRVKDF